MRQEANVRAAAGERDLLDLLAAKTRQLEESDARFRTLFGGIPEIVLVHDAGGVIFLANDVAARELERGPVELVGTNLRDFIATEDADRMKAAAVLAQAHGSAAYEITCKTPSGRRLELAVNCRAIDLDGRRAVLSVARDTAVQRSADRQRAEFMAMVAHDIRNPLSVVIGYADMLREMAGMEPDRMDMLARLVTNARAVISLVSNYLDLSRIEAGRLILDSSPVEVNEVLQQVGELYEDEARRKQIRLCVEPGRGIPLLRGDSTAIERVLGNLLHNALKYTPENGLITLASACEGEWVKLTVNDNGPGIPLDEVATIFERYRRSFDGRPKHGSGLGLFIAKALVEAHAGTIGVEKNPDGGCLFSVRLPVPSTKPERLSSRGARS